MEDDLSRNAAAETPSVVYATLVTLSGSHDTNDHDAQSLANRLIDMDGSEVVALSDLEHAQLTSGQSIQQLSAQQLQTLELLQRTDQEIDDPTNSNITVTPLNVTKNRQQENVAPPIPKGPHVCTICHKIFPKWPQLRRHMKGHEDDKPHRCQQCAASFNVPENLTLHEAIHKTPGICPECGKKFSRVASLKAHIMLHEHEENLICSECGDEFTVQSQLDRHMNEHRQEQDGVFGCRHCNLEYYTSASLKEHMKIHVKIRHTLNHRKYKKARDRTNYPHKCGSCPKRFAKPSQLKRHAFIHTGERPFECSLCKKTFNQKGALQLHERTHDDAKAFKCDLCPQTFSQKGNLRAHVTRAHNNSDNTFSCTECSCSFKKLGALNAHISRLHTAGGRAFVPGTAASNRGASSSAGNTAATVENVIHQILSDAGDKEGSRIVEQLAAGGNLSSDILAQALENSGVNADTDDAGILKEKLVSAMNTISSSEDFETDSMAGTRVILSDTAGGLKRTLHSVRRVGGIRWHQCQYCTKEFKKPSDLVRHIRTHTHEKPYKCTQCFRSFTVRSTLTAHMRTHTGHKGYKCDICEKLFSTHGSLKIHMRLHTGSKPFDCVTCGKKFRTSGHLKSHQMSHYKEGDKPRRSLRHSTKDQPLPDIPLQEPIVITESGLVQQQPRNSQIYQQYMLENQGDRPYKCTFCPHAFKKSSHLKQHVRSHTGEKPYACVQCQRSFVSSGVLKAHMKTHTGVKNYKCLICDSTFTTNGSLKRHLSTHSDMRPYMCPYCQKTFKTSVNCKKHMKTHRPELAMAMQHQDGTNQDGDGANLQALQTPQQQRQAAQQQQQPQQSQQTQQQLQSQHQQQVQNTQQPPASGPSVVPNQQYAIVTSQVDDMDEQQRQDNLLPDGQFALNTQLLNTQNIQFADGQQLTQNFIGTNQQNLNQLNYTQQFGIDINSLGGSLASTNISNILQTRDGEIVRQVAVSQTGNTAVLRLPEAQSEPQPEGDEEDEEESEDEAETSTSAGLKKAHHCDTCGKSFKKSSHLKLHIRSHTGEKPHKCTTCDRAFVSSGALKAHMRTHIGSKEFQCTLCNNMFTTQGSLTRHMVQHTTYKPFKCAHCDVQYRTNNGLKRHMKEHALEQSQDSAYHVQDMDSRIPQGARGTTLAEEDYDEVNKQLVEDVSISEKVLMESAAEKNRISELVHPEKLKEQLANLPKHANQCDQCPRSFKKPSDLVRHLRIHTGEKPYVCDKCGKSFTVKSTLISHIKTHKGHEKIFKCHICQSPFATKGTLKVHMRLHTGAKPFKCPHCEVTFRTSGHRKSHIQSHFKPQTEKRGRKPTFKVSSLPRASPQAEQQQQQQQQQQQPQVMQLMTLDSSILQNQGLMPVSLAMNQDQVLTVGDANQPTTSYQQPNVEGIQLQFSSGISGQPGISITGLDPSMLTQPIQIDTSLLAQLQQGGNINLAFNTTGLVSQPIQITDPGLIQINQDGEMISAGQGMVVQQISQLDESTGPHQTQQISVPEGATLLSTGEITPEALQQAQQQVSQLSQATLVQEAVPDSGDVIIEDEQSPSVDDHDDLSEVPVVNLDDLSDSTLVCQICQTITKDENDLAEHLLAHDVNAATARVKKINKCSMCEKIFDKPSQLERHVRIHTGERPYQCPLCPKAFNQKNSLQVHMSIHTGEKPYKCPLCSTRFTQKGNMRTHIRRAHPDQEFTYSAIIALGAEDTEDHHDVIAEAVDPSTSGQTTVAMTTSDSAEDGQYDLQLYNIQDTI